MSYNPFDNAHWNSFIGKKILLINPGAKSIEVAVVTGCDPDIGICLNEVGVVKPHTILLGPGAPNYHISPKHDQLRKNFLLNMFKQIQSGYFSYPDYIERLILYRKARGLRTSFKSDNNLACPYSM